MIEASKLSELPFFAGLGLDQLHSLLIGHRVSEVDCGQTLVMEADWGENLMVILKGLAKVRTFNMDGEEIVYSLVGEGDLLGELSVIDGEPRSADVVSLTPVIVLRLQGRVFLQQLENNPAMAIALAKLEARRLRDLNARFAISRSDATTKVLNSLSYLARKSNASDTPLAPIPALPRSEIAILSGLARETSSRAMSKLRSRGFVLEKDGCLQLTSLDPLAQRGLA